LPADGSVIFIRGGKENKSYYYLKTTVSSNPSFTKTQTQKKAVGFNKSSASITSTVVSSS
jgi:hypothetical protein